MSIKYKNDRGEWVSIWSAHVMNQDRQWDDIASISPTKEVDGNTKISSSVHDGYLHADEIKEFQFVYFRNDRLKHPDHPMLQTNESIPYEIDASSNNQMASLDPKGIIFRYERFGNISGKILYEGHIYAVTHDGEWIDVGISASTKISNDQVYYFPYNDKKRIWISARVKKLNIEAITNYGYDGYRFYQYGWNRMFTTKDFLMPANDGSTALQSMMQPDKKDRMIHPVSKRSKSYYPVALIGVARNLKRNDSMYGSTGRMYHHIEKVLVDDIEKPFNVHVFRTHTPYDQYHIFKEVPYNGRMILSAYDTITY